MSFLSMIHDSISNRDKIYVSISIELFRHVERLISCPEFGKKIEKKRR